MTTNFKCFSYATAFLSVYPIAHFCPLVHFYLQFLFNQIFRLPIQSFTHSSTHAIPSIANSLPICFRSYSTHSLFIDLLSLLFIDSPSQLSPSHSLFYQLISLLTHFPTHSLSYPLTSQSTHFPTHSLPNSLISQHTHFPTQSLPNPLIAQHTHSLLPLLPQPPLPGLHYPTNYT